MTFRTIDYEVCTWANARARGSARTSCGTSLNAVVLYISAVSGDPLWWVRRATSAATWQTDRNRMDFQ